MRIAIPHHPFYTPLTRNAAVVCQQNRWQLLEGSELECALWLKNNIASLALLTPFGYGLGVQFVDYRIIQGPIIELDDCTHAATLYLNSRIRHTTELKFASPAVEDFLIRLGTFVFQEKYEKLVHLFRAEHRDIGTLLQQYDGVVDWGYQAAWEPSLDISEEWRDLTGAPLPVAFWVCRPEDMKADIAAVVRAMQDTQLPAEQTVECSRGVHRKGTVRLQWGEYTEEALELTLEFLYYYQQFPRIPAVKIWERDPFE